MASCSCNALVPVTSILGPLVVTIIAGSVIIENIFGIPGLGKEFVRSITAHDYNITVAVFTLYAALLFYTAGTLIALASLFTRERRTQHAALVLMIVGFVCHTTWIGTICARTHHPPLTNLPEAAAFVAWCIFVVELAASGIPVQTGRFREMMIVALENDGPVTFIYASKKGLRTED